MQIYVVIPAFNEERSLAAVIEDLNSHGFSKIIVVDDHSLDRTAEVARSKNVKVLHHVINRGQGAALKTGINSALEEGADIIITFDADGQHLAKDIQPLIQPLIDNKADVVLGSRFLSNDSNVPPLRKLFLKAGALIFRIWYGIKLTDSHNGLRALSKSAADNIKLTQDKMEHASEIIEEISKNKLRYVEVPVTIKYSDYSIQHGQRTSNAFKILIKMMLKKLVR